MPYILRLEKKSILKIMGVKTKSLKLKIKVQEITIQNIANTARGCENTNVICCLSVVGDWVNENRNGKIFHTAHIHMNA